MFHGQKQILFLAAAFLAIAPAPALAWKNGPPDNKVTNSSKDCFDPPYSTHDWVADHGRALLPVGERAWLDPHRKLLIIGTEAPDYDEIPLACGVPNRGYNDTGGGNHDLRFDDFGNVTFDTPAYRAQQEYDKAVAAYRTGKHGAAAYYLGAAAHYIGDLSQYGHTMKGESHHADFEVWVGGLTPSFAGGGVFERFIQVDGLEPRSAYDAVIRTGKLTRYGKSPVIAPTDMDGRNGSAARTSIGHTLSKAVNETADMLHGFYVTVVKPAQTRLKKYD